jgi:hypothetical protein
LFLVERGMRWSMAFGLPHHDALGFAVPSGKLNGMESDWANLRWKEPWR